MNRSAAFDARRAQLITLGKRVFSTQPYDSVRTEEIAADAGISVGLLYHYFGNKRGFYVATLQAAAEDLLLAIPDAPLLPAQVVPAAGQFLAFVEANAPLYNALVRGGIGADPEVHGILEHLRATIIDRLLGPAGATPALRLQMYGWFGLIEFSVLRWLTHQEVGRDELIDWIAAAAPGPLRLREPSPAP